MTTHSLINRVITCIARTTRYPAEVLLSNADLEDDLGIDSVKQAEVIAALSREFDVDLQSRRDSSIRTIGDVAEWIEAALGSSRQGSDPGLTAGPQLVADRDLGVAPPDRSAPEPVAPQPMTEAPLAGRVALVTGSGRGIGRTIVEHLARLGATVIVNSFHSRDQGEQTTAELTAAGASAVHMWGSIAKPEHVEQIFSDIDRRFGYLDILICNASDGKIGTFSELTTDDWDRAFRTNVSGHHHCAIQAARRMQPRGGGAIVTMSAVGARQYVHGLGSQGVAKAAVEAMTRYLACELAPQGVRVNCVVAGPVYGELLAKMPNPRASQNHWEAMTPGGRLTSPQDVAETIGFLVSDRARAINGALWTVDRGFSAHADSRFQDHGLVPASLLGNLG